MSLPSGRGRLPFSTLLGAGTQPVVDDVLPIDPLRQAAARLSRFGAGGGYRRTHREPGDARCSVRGRNSNLYWGEKTVCTVFLTS